MENTTVKLYTKQHLQQNVMIPALAFIVFYLNQRKIYTFYPVQTVDGSESFYSSLDLLSH